uniref:Myb-like domain-containing protein n=2 Tax=Salix viminalis TaxID=40686 RepID=A0A6N2K9P1_SALVM
MVLDMRVRLRRPVRNQDITDVFNKSVSRDFVYCSNPTLGLLKLPPPPFPSNFEREFHFSTYFRLSATSLRVDCMPKSQQTYIFFVGWVSMWFCFCINLDFWTGCCFKTQFPSLEHPHNSANFIFLMDRRRRRRRQAKINISESEEVSSIEWEFINMSEQEEDLIYRMYRLVGERWDLIAGRIPGRKAEEIERFWIMKHREGFAEKRRLHSRVRSKTSLETLINETVLRKDQSTPENLLTMVKLASARESRMYGPKLSKNRAEYMNAGLYLLATIVLVGGFVAELSKETKPGLSLLLIALLLIAVVNLHDLFAHLAGIDYLFPLMGYDTQFALVEFAVPVIQALGALLSFLALWVLGSIHNSCQIYERADGHVQILQQSVHIPFLIGSSLFFVGSILNIRDQAGWGRHGLGLLSKTWVWIGIFGSLMLFIGGLTNVVKVFEMQQIDGVRLEKLRGGAQERLIRERDGHAPLIQAEERRGKRAAGGTRAAPTPYKDVLVAQP